MPPINLLVVSAEEPYLVRKAPPNPDKYKTLRPRCKSSCNSANKICSPELDSDSSSDLDTPKEHDYVGAVPVFASHMNPDSRILVI
jgi:hypothetical protein